MDNETKGEIILNHAENGKAALEINLPEETVWFYQN